MNLKRLILTQNACYKAGRTIKVKGIMVHSTGANNPNLKRYVNPDDGLLGNNPNRNHWNQDKPDGRLVCVHGFIGKLADGSIATYQTLPWNYRGWHGGGTVNDTHIGIELCEDGLADKDYFDAVYMEAVELCAYLCKEYDLNPTEDGVIIGHYEGHARGMASNHSDPKNWFPKFGKSMDAFRTDVKDLLINESSSKHTASVSMEDIITQAVKHATAIISSNEGNYGSVNKNDNGALSIGKLQWHAGRALSLMQIIVNANLMQAQNILGIKLYDEIISASSNAWNNRIVDVDEAAKISILLATTEGTTAQDTLIINDITTYVKKGISYGLKDCGALIYFSDGVNQYGTNSSLWKQITEAALNATGDITAMWNATKTHTQSYLTRRERVYKAVCDLNLEGIPFKPYLVRITGNPLNIRRGPGTDYGTNGSITDNGVYTIIEESTGKGAKNWGKLKSGAGWIALEYTKRV